jgi:hypothetical protein
VGTFTAVAGCPATSSLIQMESAPRFGVAFALQSTTQYTSNKRAELMQRP